MTKKRDYEQHPLAKIIPAMSDKQFEALKEDIKINGLRNPIVLYQDMILDGWHRYLACKFTKTNCRAVEYKGSTPLQEVISLNLKRRHLNEEEIKRTVARALPELRKEAKKRSLANLKRGNKAPDRAKTPTRERVRDQAAKAAGVTSYAVRELEEAERKAPTLYKKWVEGKGGVTFAQIKKSIAQKEGKAEVAPQGIIISSDGESIPILNMKELTKAAKEIWEQHKFFVGHTGHIEYDDLLKLLQSIGVYETDTSNVVAWEDDKPIDKFRRRSR